jgi:hypothetical protein
MLVETPRKVVRHMAADFLAASHRRRYLTDDARTILYTLRAISERCGWPYTAEQIGRVLDMGFRRRW